MKNSRITMTPRSAPKSFGLFALIESRRVILPLKGVECDFSVLSGIGEVSMTQIFLQENKKPLDCEYLFPLPADASVYLCEADINGRTIRAQVREREEARRLAAEKKAAGFRTAMVEAERENLFTLSLGNVQPGDLVTIQLKYFQTLRSLAGQPSIEVPFCPGIRYIPGKPLVRSNTGKGVIDDTDQVPDASRITPVRIDAEHPDAAYIDVRGTLDGKFVDETAVSSPSHEITIQRVEDQLRVSLSGKGEVPDRDFVLRWTEKKADAVASRAWTRERDGQTYALLEIRAPKEAPTERAPADFYFLVDRSGSMQGEKWNKAAEALQSCIQVLGPDDRAMVTFFESDFRDFAERPLNARKLFDHEEFQRVKDLGTAGGTELRPALQHVLDVAAKHSATQRKNLILITDAQIGNESAILELMKPVADFPVHCFGIDVALNDSLLLALCRQQGGTFHSLNPNDNIQGCVAALGKTLGEPVLVDLRLSDGWEAADAAIPSLYAGQVHYLSARSSDTRPLELCGLNASSQPVSIQFERRSETLEAPYLDWCRSRIRRLLAEGNDSAAVELSVKSNLVCRLTAFIAWDESEKVPVATHELVQPNVSHRELFSQRSVARCELRDFDAMMIGAMEEEAVKSKTSLRLKRGVSFSRASDSAFVDQLQLLRELSDISHLVGVHDWQTLIKAISDWLVKADVQERPKRIDAIRKLLEEVKLCAFGPKDRNESREKVRRLLEDFVRNVSAKP